MAHIPQFEKAMVSLQRVGVFKSPSNELASDDFL
jgi:hypothetical protein